jgi:glutamine synthetase
MSVDSDLEGMDKEQLAAEIRRLRAGIREHRNKSGHGLCWYVPELWSLLPEKTDPLPAVPPEKEFLEQCRVYRQSLDHPYERHARVLEAVDTISSGKIEPGREAEFIVSILEGLPTPFLAGVSSLLQRKRRRDPEAEPLVIEHDDHPEEIVRKMNEILKTMGLRLEDLTAEDDDFITYRIAGTP